MYTHTVIEFGTAAKIFRLWHFLEQVDVPAQEALRLISQETLASDAMNDIAAQVAGGSAPAQEFARYGELFPSYVPALLEVTWNNYPLADRLKHLAIILASSECLLRGGTPYHEVTRLSFFKLLSSLLLYSNDTTAALRVAAPFCFETRDAVILLEAAQAGQSLHEILKARPANFEADLVSMIGVGEATSDVSEACALVADILEARLRTQYPSAGRLVSTEGIKQLSETWRMSRVLKGRSVVEALEWLIGEAATPEDIEVWRLIKRQIVAGMSLANALATSTLRPFAPYLRAAVSTDQVIDFALVFQLLHKYLEWELLGIQPAV